MQGGLGVSGERSERGGRAPFAAEAGSRVGLEPPSLTPPPLTPPPRYVVIDNPVPNAFVSDLAPRKIFVNSGLLTSVGASEDELGLVLGHEISHLLHGHTKDGNQTQFFLAMAQVVFLMVIPIDFFSPLLIWAAENFQERELCAHSRENEAEADETGLKIAALGCFNTHRGPHIFKKLGEFSAEVTGGASLPHWSDTHPMPLDRERRLVELSKKINCDDAKRCHGVLERMRESFLGR